MSPETSSPVAFSLFIVLSRMRFTLRCFICNSDTNHLIISGNPHQPIGTLVLNLVFRANSYIDCAQLTDFAETSRKLEMLL